MFTEPYNVELPPSMLFQELLTKVSSLENIENVFIPYMMDCVNHWSLPNDDDMQPLLVPNHSIYKVVPAPGYYLLPEQQDIRYMTTGTINRIFRTFIRHYESSYIAHTYKIPYDLSDKIALLMIDKIVNIIMRNYSKTHPDEGFDFTNLQNKLTTLDLFTGPFLYNKPLSDTSIRLISSYEKQNVRLSSNITFDYKRNHKENALDAMKNSVLKYCEPLSMAHKIHKSRAIKENHFEQALFIENIIRESMDDEYPDFLRAMLSTYEEPIKLDRLIPIEVYQDGKEHIDYWQINAFFYNKSIFEKRTACSMVASAELIQTL